MPHDARRSAIAGPALLGVAGRPANSARHRLAPALGRPPRARRVLIAMEAVMAVSAFGGAWYAIGGAPDVPTEWLRGTPFDDYVVPGVILGAVVGGSQVAAAVTARWRRRHARAASLGAAVVLLTWIVTQLAMIGYVSPLQPIVLAWALVTGVLALRSERPE